MTLLPIALDFETYSEVDIKKCGVYVYAKHPSTRILCMSWAEIPEDESVPKEIKYLEPSKALNVEFILKRWKKEERRLVAWNSQFEYLIAKYVAGVDLTEALGALMGFPTENPSLEQLKTRGFCQISDPSKIAAMLSLPRNLGNCGKALKISQDHEKDKYGKTLISLCCVPTKRNATQQHYEDLVKYNQQDIRALIETRRLLHRPDLTPLELNVLMKIDPWINENGIPIDLESVKSAIKIYKKATQRNLNHLVAITEGRLSDVSKSKALKQFLSEEGFETNTLAKAALSESKIPDTASDLAREVLTIRRQNSMTSIKKYEALLRGVDDDGRVRGTLKYCGCSTGRWSASQFQPQNLPRVHKDFDLSWVEALKTGDLDFINTIYNCPFTVLSSCIRSMVKAPEGKMLTFCDFNSVETRITAWISGQQNILDIFREGGCIYRYTAATAIYNIPIDQVTSEQRTAGKVATLALGFGGGAGALSRMATTYGLVIRDEEKELIKFKWRDANPKIVQFWYSLEKVVKSLLEESTDGHFLYSAPYRHNLQIKYFRCPRSNNTYLEIQLPSGRSLYYFNPMLVEGQITYEGIDSTSKNKNWGRIKTYGGKLTENIVQAIARDCMAEAMLAIYKNHREEIKIILTLHDEIICEHDKSLIALPIIKDIMSITLTWAPGLPLAASGITAERFVKHD